MFGSSSLRERGPRMVPIRISRVTPTHILGESHIGLHIIPREHLQPEHEAFLKPAMDRFIASGGKVEMHGDTPENAVPVGDAGAAATPVDDAAWLANQPMIGATAGNDMPLRPVMGPPAPDVPPEVLPVGAGTDEDSFAGSPSVVPLATAMQNQGLGAQAIPAMTPDQIRIRDEYVAKGGTEEEANAAAGIGPATGAPAEEVESAVGHFPAARPPMGPPTPSAQDRASAEYDKLIASMGKPGYSGFAGIKSALGDQQNRTALEGLDLGLIGDEKARAANAKAVAIDAGIKADDAQKIADQTVLDTRRAHEQELAKIDPNQYFQSLSLGNKVGAAISVILGGIGSGLTRGPNVALGVLKDAINTNIESQKQQYRDYAMQTGDIRADQHFARADAWQMVQRRLDSEAAKSDAVLASPLYDLTRQQIAAQADNERILGIGHLQNAVKAGFENANARNQLALGQLQAKQYADTLKAQQGGDDWALTRWQAVQNPKQHISYVDTGAAPDSRGNLIPVSQQKMGLLVNESAAAPAIKAFTQQNDLRSKWAPVKAILDEGPTWSPTRRAALRTAFGAFQMSFPAGEEEVNRYTGNEADAVAKLIQGQGDPTKALDYWENTFTGKTRASEQLLDGLLKQRGLNLKKSYLIPPPGGWQ